VHRELILSLNVRAIRTQFVSPFVNVLLDPSSRFLLPRQPRIAFALLVLLPAILDSRSNPALLVVPSLIGHAHPALQEHSNQLPASPIVPHVQLLALLGAICLVLVRPLPHLSAWLAHLLNRVVRINF